MALRYHAIYLDVDRRKIDMTSSPAVPVLAFTARLKENGYCVSEELLHALSMVSTDELSRIEHVIGNIMGVNLNWAPLVKGWNVPTGENRADHLITWIANVFGGAEAGISGTTLECGHFIPDGTFPLERYNGCPFCGRPFRTSDFVYMGQASKLRELRLFTDADLKEAFRSLLESPTPLDGTQKESLAGLLSVYEVPEDANIIMKETAMRAVKSLIAHGKESEAAKYLSTPSDILRYLWFEKTGNVQIIEPKTLIEHERKLNSHMCRQLDKGAQAAEKMKEKLRLKYGRKDCHRIASWLNGIEMDAAHAAENMNPKRGMWVRMIRALRLGEYSRRRGFEHLKEILDVFYKREYTTWQGNVDSARSKNDAETTLSMLKQRPGVFARSLFSTMLRFGSEKTVNAFDEISDKLPSRLLLSLGNASESYFVPTTERLARPVTGGAKPIPYNKLLGLYSEEDRKGMITMVRNTYKASVSRHFADEKTTARSIYIDPMLFNIPVSVGDRSTSVQDTSCALMGTRFPVEGDAIRLFLQWGKGLHAQHLDMDLSCRITMPDDKVYECAYYQLKAVGAKHSGDIREIPEMVGTAEYIELSMPELIEAGARYVTFTCNAYSIGALSPDLVVGWMDSANPMRISEETGVAYDPSCVQHMVRISEGNLAKGLVFGVLDVAKREIIWLEMPFTSQTVRGCSFSDIEALIDRLANKLSVGELLQMKAAAQNLSETDHPEDADEAYTYEWALNPSEVSRLLFA